MSQMVHYRCSPTVVWVKDAHQTLLVNRETERSLTLRDVEAAIWDWLTVGYSYARIVQMLSLTFNLPQENAGCTLERMLQNWHSAGILQAFE